jgi:hypothetical protein
MEYYLAIKAWNSVICDNTGGLEDIILSEKGQA